MRCCVKNCGNDNKAKNISKHRITFHTFPKDPNQRAAWIQSLSLPDSTQLTSRTVVCSDHFLEEEFYDTKDNIRRLKTGVVPSIRIDTNAPIASRVCMICLALDAKMYHLKDYNLAHMYVDVIGIQPRTHAEGRLPQQVCWECRARLTSAAAFKAKAILSDSLLNDQCLKIGHILHIHQKHAHLQSSLSRSHVLEVLELLDTENIGDPKSSSNTQTELADTAFKDEFEIEVNKSLTGRIQIKEEEKNLLIEDITESHQKDVKIEIDIPEENSEFVDVNFSDDEATEVCMETNDSIEATIIKDIESINNHKVEIAVSEINNHDDFIMIPKKEKIDINNDTTTSIFNKHLQRDQTDFYTVDINNIVSSEPRVCTDKMDIPEVEKKKVAVKKAAEKDASVVLRRTRDQTCVKPRYQPVDENVIKITALNREALIQEVVDREHSLKYKQAPFKCTVCFLGFPTQDVKTRHIIRHKEESGPFKCEVCKIRFRKKKNYRSHMTKQHTVECSCKLCPFVTRDRTAAILHIKFHAGSIFKCSQCGLEFEKQTTLLSHKRLKHISDFVCELCGFTFVSTKGVTAHKIFKHKDDDKNAELKGPFCELCDVKFLSQGAYENHLRLSSKHIKNENDPNRMSNESSKLLGYQKRKTVRRRVEHTVTSPKEPVTCEQCGVELENLGAYARHFRRIHPGVNRTKFAAHIVPSMCEHCGKVFVNSTLLSCHIMWAHTGEKRFQCDHCKKMFCTKARLATHMSIHMPSRPSFQCRLCGKMFAFANNLRRHMFLHTGLKPFKCDDCDKGFATSCDLRAHVDHVHLKKPRPKRVRRRVKKEEMSSLEY